MHIAESCRAQYMQTLSLEVPKYAQRKRKNIKSFFIQAKDLEERKTATSSAQNKTTPKNDAQAQQPGRSLFSAPGKMVKGKPTGTKQIGIARGDHDEVGSALLFTEKTSSPNSPDELHERAQTYY